MGEGVDAVLSLLAGAMLVVALLWARVRVLGGARSSGRCRHVGGLKRLLHPPQMDSRAWVPHPYEQFADERREDAGAWGRLLLPLAPSSQLRGGVRWRLVDSGYGTTRVPWHRK